MWGVEWGGGEERLLPKGKKWTNYNCNDMLAVTFYIKACVLNNSARALLAFQVTYFPTRNRIKI